MHSFWAQHKAEVEGRKSRHIESFELDEDVEWANPPARACAAEEYEKGENLLEVHRSFHRLLDLWGLVPSGRIIRCSSSVSHRRAFPFRSFPEPVFSSAFPSSDMNMRRCYSLLLQCAPNAHPCFFLSGFTVPLRVLEGRGTVPGTSLGSILGEIQTFEMSLASEGYRPSTNFILRVCPLISDLLPPSFCSFPFHLDPSSFNF
ncbi:hypothetical protein C8R44DRAFT_203045 [Mycena epipterygia]|nr:hypothetical protein C8R44DRAFT_203045 [Mycena epipterygia]